MRPSARKLTAVLIFATVALFLVLQHNTAVFNLNMVAESIEPSQQVTEHKGPKEKFLVYIKVEKTGSSTFSNIFSSYGYRNRLNMIMSTVPESLINTRELEPGKSWDIGPKKSPAHVMEQHARYRRDFYDKYFPDALYVTSIREPVKWFISYVDFMNVYKQYNPREVLESDKLFYKTRHFVTGMQKQAHNVFLQWLGFDVYKSSDIDAVTDYIENFLAKKFKLVMLTEYFDEGLVLLKRIANWNLGDIFYTYANEATKKSGVIFTEKERAKLLDKEHNLADNILYDYFNKTFWDKVSQEKNFFEEVHAFRKLNKNVQKFCQSSEVIADASLYMSLHTKWDGNFNVTSEHCMAMRLVNGAGFELGAALDRYIPTRGTKTIKEIRKHFDKQHSVKKKH